MEKSFVRPFVGGCKRTNGNFPRHPHPSSSHPLIFSYHRSLSANHAELPAVCTAFAVLCVRVHVAKAPAIQGSGGAVHQSIEPRAGGGLVPREPRRSSLYASPISSVRWSVLGAFAHGMDSCGDVVGLLNSLFLRWLFPFLCFNKDRAALVLGQL